eukprot:COSAG01_NODE_4618_length_4876_cov_8.446305_8_plen_211_part_00
MVIFWQWWSAASTAHPHAYPGYALLYDAEWMQGSDVLVIGAGAGMGLLNLESAGRPASITAVELDPVVTRLLATPGASFAHFNGHIYDRTSRVWTMDGREYLDATEATYDVIIYEGSFLTAAHPQVSVGTEAYLYTLEGLQAARARLRPPEPAAGQDGAAAIGGGVGIVLHAGPTESLVRVLRGAASVASFLAAVSLRFTYVTSVLIKKY